MQASRKKAPQKWAASKALNRPLTILGCEKTWFLLSGMLGYAVYTGAMSFIAGAVVFVAGYGAGLAAYRRDPAMLGILQATRGQPARYDPGKPDPRPAVRLL